MDRILARMEQRMSKWWNPTRALGRNASELVWRLPSCPWRGEKIEAITPRDNADSLKSVDCRLDRQSAAAILPLSKIGRPLFPICPVVQ
ncbi:MAG: hypothetical protein A2W31_18450 [Planctomycetes bacterium RBG_16_64_10]|nr:MAG: hypothetical protein A2W31_18450 [Planctomycetes bacterium RBG_16_64_10]